MTHLAPVLRPLIEDLLPTIFFAALFAITGNIYLATGIGIAIGVMQIVILKIRHRRIDMMQWASLALVIVLGGATFHAGDPRFMMIKPSIAKFAIGAVMTRPNWMARYLPPIVRENISVRMLTIYSAMWPVMMFGLGIANLVIAFTMSQQAWAWFIAIVPLASTWLLVAFDYITLRMLVVRRIRLQRISALSAAE